MFRLSFVIALAFIIVAGYGTLAEQVNTHLPLVSGNETVSSTSLPTLISTQTATSTPTATATFEGSDTETPTSTPTETPTQTTTATSTPTPSVTPTLTPTPSPTLTRPASAITVLDNHRAFVDSIDYLHIVGEVKNDTGEKARFVRITANLFDAQNQLIDTDFGYTSLDILSPGETACFQVLFLGAPAYSYYTFETSFQDTVESSLPIAVFGDSGSYNSVIDDWYEIVGQARNDSNRNAEFVKIIGTLYQSNGQVLDCDYTYTNADILTPQQVSTWKITFSNALNGTVSSYRL